MTRRARPVNVDVDLTGKELDLRGRMGINRYIGLLSIF